MSQRILHNFVISQSKFMISWLHICDIMPTVISQNYDTLVAYLWYHACCDITKVWYHSRGFGPMISLYCDVIVGVISQNSRSRPSRHFRVPELRLQFWTEMGYTSRFRDETTALSLKERHTNMRNVILPFQQGIHFLVSWRPGDCDVSNSDWVWPNRHDLRFYITVHGPCNDPNHAKQKKYVMSRDFPL